MKLKLLFLSALAVSVSLSGFSQQTKILTAEKHNEYGLVYSLPTTALQISVTARKETRTPGPYRQYAKRYLGTSNVISEEKTTWTITEVSVVPFGVKDDRSQFLMQLKAGAPTYIGVASDGMILSINAEPKNQNNPSEPISNSSRVLKSDGGVEDFLQYVDMDFVSAQNSMRQAEMVANSLMDIRESYISLTRGTADNVPTDGRQLELMLNSLKDQEGAFTRAFAGSVSIEEFSTGFVYIPQEDGEEVLFRMSDFAGIVDSEDFSGSPVYIKTEITNEGTLPEDVNGEPKKFPKDGVVYAIPGSAKISIYTGNNQLFSKEYEFSQFGTTFGLAPALFTDKKNPSYARFSPVTGALIEIGSVGAE